MKYTVVAPADEPLPEPLTPDEETVLLALAQGALMAPIGRWQEPLEALAGRGLAVKLDASNYAATPAGRALAERKDDQFLRGWIDDSNRAAAHNRQQVIAKWPEGLYGAISDWHPLPSLRPTPEMAWAHQVKALLRDILAVANERYNSYDALMYEVGRWHHVVKKLLGEDK